MDSEKIKKTIKSKGWTLDRIGTEMGISAQAVSSIINGNPTLDKLNAIAGIVGVSVGELLGCANFNAVVFDGEQLYKASSWAELKKIVEEHESNID